MVAQWAIASSKASGGPGRKIQIEGVLVSVDEALAKLLQQLSEEAQHLPAKSKEACAATWLKAAELYLKLHPPTLRDWVDRAFELPDFDPQKLVDFLRE